MGKALEWATTATGSNFPGDPKSFSALRTKAAMLDKLGRADEAAAVLNAALPFGTVTELQHFGRQLIAEKKAKAALEVFQFNYQKNPEQFTTLVSMARGLPANGNYSKAVEFANKALPLAPNNATKEMVTAIIEKLKKGKDIN